MVILRAGSDLDVQDGRQFMAGVMIAQRKYHENGIKGILKELSKTIKKQENRRKQNACGGVVETAGLEPVTSCV